LPSGAFKLICITYIFFYALILSWQILSHKITKNLVFLQY
jgi:hypothetical protein